MRTACRWLLLLLGLVASLAAQEPRLDAIRQRGALRVGTTGDYPPFSYRANRASPFIGLEVELAQRLATALGVKLELVPTSWPGLMSDLAAARFDVAMSGVSITVERQKVAAFSFAYLQDGKTPIARCEDEARFQTLEAIDRPGVRVIVNPGGTNERFVRARLHRATLTVHGDNLTIFDQIVAGRADLMITDAIEARLQQRLRPQLCAIHPESPFDRTEKAWLLPREDVWKTTVDAWLQPLVERQEVQRLLAQWLDHPWPRAAPAAIPLAPLRDLIGERLALMPDVARYKWNTRGPIEDLPREQQIIAGLKRQAEAMGIPARWAEDFFRAQIEAAKVIQRELFARWTAERAGPFPQAPDLATVTRPRLDALTPRLLRELAAAWPALSDPGQSSRVTREMESLAMDGVISLAAARVALAPFGRTEATSARP